MSTALQNPRFRNRHRPQYVTGRGSYSNTINYRRETPEPEPSNSPPSSQGIYNDHRTAVMLCSFMGNQTTVKTRNGSTYKGHTIGFSDEGDIAMSDVRLDNDNTQKHFVPGIIIPKDKFVVCKTNGVDLKGLYNSSTDFTDSGIASRINGSCDAPMKELQPFYDEDATEITSSVTLDDPNDGWDSGLMFQANRDKFNVQSTYNEDLHEYTTKLPDPNSEGYEEKEKFAKKHAEAIEQSDAYQSRIAKELKDGDEEYLYSAVHRGTDESSTQPSRHPESNSSSGKNNSTVSPQKEDTEQTMRNESFRVQGRGSYHLTNHPQQPPHSHQQQIARQMNNQFQGPPPSMGPLSRNHGLSSQHPRHPGQQNHAASHHPHHQQHPPHQYQQQVPPPPHHPGMQQSILPISHRHHQQQRPSSHQQSMAPLSQQSSSKSNSPHFQNLPTTSSSPSLLSMSQVQHPPPPHKFNVHHKQSPIQQSPCIKSSNVTSPVTPLASPHEPMRPVSLQTSIESNNSEVVDQKISQRDRQQPYHQKLALTGPPPPTSGHVGGQKVNESTQLSTSVSLTDTQLIAQPLPTVTSPPQSTQATDRKIGRGLETSPEERNKIGQSLHDFSKKFVLESNGSNSQEALRQEDANEDSPVSSAQSSVVTTPVNATPETSLQVTEQEQITEKELLEESSQTSKLNPNAKEFKPKSQPVPIEAQSPSPQPHSSPHMPQIVHYPPQQAVLVPYPIFMANSQRKRATVSLGAGVVSDLAAHQVTGQPLLATQPPNMMYLQAAGQALPTTYQLYSPQIINSRVVAPGSINMAQAGQVTAMEQISAQNQPQPVFVATQQQPLHTPIPAHLHPQPVHAQAISLSSSIQQSQSTHMPNPVPSPVQHQQQSSHHLSQGPPHSSANPQSAHYPQITVNYTHAMPAVPRTSMSGQQSITAGHSPVSFISAPQFVFNGGTAQYTFASALQPQATQNSSHGTGPQPQYVIMPQPSTQVHPSLQQHAAQSYTSSNIPFQPQQHLMQVPPHIPANHNSNPSQSSPHIIHSNMPVGMHQQVSNAQPNMYMQVPSTVQQFQQHQQ